MKKFFQSFYKTYFKSQNKSILEKILDNIPFEIIPAISDDWPARKRIIRDLDGPEWEIEKQINSLNLSLEEEMNLISQMCFGEDYKFEHTIRFMSLLKMIDVEIEMIQINKLEQEVQDKLKILKQLKASL